MKKIGSFRQIEEGKGTSMNIFDDTMVQIVRDGKVIYKDTSRRFLMHISFMQQFIDTNRVIEHMKDWKHIYRGKK